MNTQHTPGPWILGPETCADGRRVLAGANGALTVGWSVGYAPKPGSNERPMTLVEAKANAQLICAAPDLLAACEQLVGLHRLALGGMHVQIVLDTMLKIAEQAQEAIAKATGGAK